MYIDIDPRVLIALIEAVATIWIISRRKRN